MRKTATITIVLLLAGAAYGQATTKYKFKQNCTPGNYVITSTNEMDQLTQMGAGMTMAQKVGLMTVTEMKIGKPAQGGQKVRMAYKRIKQSVTGGPMSMEYDSAAPAEEQSSMLAPVVGAMLDSEVSFTVAPDGTVSKVSGMDKMWEKASQSQPGAGAMLGSMKEQFGNRMIDQFSGEAKAILPAKAVGKGDLWLVEADQSVAGVGKMKMANDCKLADVKETAAGKVAVIEFVGTATSDEPPPARSIGPVQAKFEQVQVNRSGTVKVDMNSGMVTDADIVQASKIVMQMASPQGQGAPMKMTILQKGKTVTQLRQGKYIPPTTRPAGEATTKPAKATDS